MYYETPAVMLRVFFYFGTGFAVKCRLLVITHIPQELARLLLSCAVRWQRK